MKNQRRTLRRTINRRYLHWAILPTLLIFIMVLLLFYIELRRQEEAKSHLTIEYTAGQMQTYLDYFIEGFERFTAFTPLASLSDEERGDRLGALLARDPNIDWIYFINPAGEVENSISRHLRVRDQESLPPRYHADLRISMQENRSRLGEFHINPITLEPVIAVFTPVWSLKNSEIEGIMITDVRVRFLWSFLASLPNAEHNTAYIADESGTILAHPVSSVVIRREHAPAVGTELLIAGSEGRAVFLAEREIEIGGHTFRIINETEIEPLILPLLYISLLLASIFSILFFGTKTWHRSILKGVVDPIESMSVMVDAVAGGDFDQRIDETGDQELTPLIVGLNSMALRLGELFSTISAMAEERGELIREIHHRVKNNLQVIQSIINLELEDREFERAPRQALERLRTRIHGMSLMHDLLFQIDDYTKIQVEEYLQSIFEHVMEEIPANFVIRTEAVELPLERAIALGMAGAEFAILLQSGNETFSIQECSLAREGGLFRFSLRGSDLGLKADRNLSLIILEALSQQLGGNFVATRESLEICFS